MKYEVYFIPHTSYLILEKMYDYFRALHIIFVVTWFAGMFYMPRLFIYNTEAADMPEPAPAILRQQFSVMMSRLWYGITWPSAILTLLLGSTVLFHPARGWYRILFEEAGLWLLLKLIFVIGLYLYHYTLHIIFKQEMNGIFKYTSQQLRLWNEVATIFLIAIVMLVVVKQGISLLWGMIGLVLFIALLMSGIKIYKLIRDKR